MKNSNHKNDEIFSRRVGGREQNHFSTSLFFKDNVSIIKKSFSALENYCLKEKKIFFLPISLGFKIQNNFSQQCH